MVFTLPRYSTCCYCISLRIGSLIIGYVSILLSCFTIAMVSLAIYRVAVFVDSNKDKISPEHSAYSLARTALGLYISFTYYLIVFLYNIFFSVVLLIGVHTNKPHYLRAYFKATLFLFALGAALVVLTCVFMGFLATVPVLTWVFALFCCLVIVRSTFLEMEEKEKQPIQHITAEYELQPYTQRVPLMA